MRTIIRYSLNQDNGTLGQQLNSILQGKVLRKSVRAAGTSEDIGRREPFAELSQILGKCIDQFEGPAHLGSFFDDCR